MLVSESIERYLNDEIKVIRKIDVTIVADIISEISKTYRSDGTIFVIGNGGSAANASHAVCDLGKSTVSVDRPRIKTVSLSDNVSWMTAIANDIAYDRIFSEQIINLGEHGDLLIAISASGNSKNIVRGIETAKEIGMKTVGLLGFDGGEASKLCDISLVIPSFEYGYIEDCHMMIIHAIVDYIKKTGLENL